MHHTSFSAHYYVTTLSGLLRKPGVFFRESLDQETSLRAFLFLLISGVFSTAAALLMNPDIRALLPTGILFVNAIGMSVLAAFTGYGIMVMMVGKKISFARFFNIYAFSSGVILLASWIPFLVIITEPWRWILIGTGLVKGGQMKKFQAFMIIILSITVMTLLFWSILPVLSVVKGKG
ncbi:MAG: YIP1 family protein [Proteobacteria bacterium]|nr:YIP1 family protein [Pseudomonadota bacterium]